MSLKVCNGIEMTFKKLVLRSSSGKCTIECLGETHCGPNASLSAAFFNKIAPERS
jgi:hypothetical protein